MAIGRHLCNLWLLLDIYLSGLVDIAVWRYNIRELYHLRAGCLPYIEGKTVIQQPNRTKTWIIYS